MREVAQHNLQKETEVSESLIDSMDENGETALHRAAWKGDTETVKALLEKGANPNLQKKGGWTALHFAARKGPTETVTALLEKGADPNPQNEHGMTALDWAVYSGHTKILETLFLHGAALSKNLNDQLKNPPAILPLLLNNLALIEATEQADIAKIDYLVTKKGATYPGQGETPFMYRVNQLASALFPTFGDKEDHTPNQATIDTFQRLNGPLKSGLLYPTSDRDTREAFASALGEVIKGSFGGAPEGFDTYLQQVREKATDLPKEHVLMTHVSQPHVEDILQSRAASVARKKQIEAPNPVFNQLQQRAFATLILRGRAPQKARTWLTKVNDGMKEFYGKSDLSALPPMSDDQKKVATDQLSVIIVGVGLSNIPDAQEVTQIATLTMARELVEKGYAQNPVKLPTLSALAAKACLSKAEEINTKYSASKWCTEDFVKWY